jgi:hypothetical protein
MPSNYTFKKQKQKKKLEQVFNPHVAKNTLTYISNPSF